MRHLAPSLAVLLAVAACGGDDNKNPPNDPNNPNNPATLVRVSQGAITEKTATSTSFRVNDTTYDAQGAKVVTVDDNPAGHEALLPGMVVSVLVDDKGAASEIRARSAVRGPVSAPTASSVTVGGQVVRFDDTTHFEDNTLRSGLGTAGRVRVSGFPDDRGGIRATRIGRDASSTEFEVHGVVSNLSGNGFTLAPSRGATQGWPVTLASGVSLPSGLANGSIVEVRAASAPAAAFGAITATSIKLDDDLSRLSGARQAEVEGYVTSISTPSATIPEFVIRGFTVRTAANTRWLGGGPADLLVGSKLEAEGSLDASGVLTATKITYRDGYRLQGPASAVTGTGTNGSFQLLGRTIQVTDATELNDSITLANVSGQNVEVRGYPASNGTDLVALRVRLGTGGGGGGGTSSRIFIQAPVTANAQPNLTMFGFTIVTNASTTYRDRNQASLAAADFFNAVSAGTVVKARGANASALTGTTLTAEEVELEDDR